MFIHDAILESITCGNTQVSAADLNRAVTKLKQRDPHTKLTGYELQFKVHTIIFPYLILLLCFHTRYWSRSVPELRIKSAAVL